MLYMGFVRLRIAVALYRITVLLLTEITASLLCLSSCVHVFPPDKSYSPSIVFNKKNKKIKKERKKEWIKFISSSYMQYSFEYILSWQTLPYNKIKKNEVSYQLILPSLNSYISSH